jgi:hypothetical protein
MAGTIFTPALVSHQGDIGTYTIEKAAGFAEEGLACIGTDVRLYLAFPRHCGLKQ